MRFGSYEVLEQVAVGSTGTVFRARHTGSGRVVALKQLSPALRSAPGVLDALRAEASVLRALDDPHVVALLDAGLDDDPPWIAEQWVDGPTLERLLQVHGQLTPEQGVGVLRGAVQGLAHAHGRGVVHRDVAPGNVLLDAAGTSMLVDFGLAAPVGDGTACGTPAFVSPEAASGQPVGPTGDVYSAGAVLFLLLSGRPPFPAGDVAQVLRAHRETPAPPLDGPADGLRELVGRCLAKDPTDRPADGAALLAELAE
jgi:eukaryotic-like serine/threonine-protein kinase